MGRGLSSRQRVAERRAAALQMRREGKPYAVIAAALDYASANSASKDVHRALQDAVMEQGRQLLDLERDRLDGLQAILWPLAANGDVRAARELIRLMERRARLLGLDRAAAERFQSDETQESKSILARFQLDIEAAYASLPD